MDIKMKLIPISTKRRSGIKLTKVTFFVDHDTGNANSTAQNNVDYYISSANTMSASAHAFVDDKGVIVCIPCLSDAEKAWQVMYEKPKDNELFKSDANDAAIGTELCYFPDDKARTLKAYNNYIEFQALLAEHHKVDPSRRAGHYELDPERRTDPNNALQHIGKTYNDMKKDIVAKYNQLYVNQEVISTSNSIKEVLNVEGDIKIIEVPEYAKEAWEWAKTNGINDGKVDSMEEIRTMCYLYRLYQLLKKKGMVI